MHRGHRTLPAALVALVLGWGAALAEAQEIVRITVRPATVELAIDDVVLLAAEATFADGSVANISELVEWKTSNGSVARVSNTRGSKGKVTARAAGHASISVRDPVSGVASGQSGGNATVLVLGRLRSLRVTPDDRRIEPGSARTFTAVGTFTNGLTRDVTEQVSWASSNPGVAQVSNDPGRRGRVTAVGPGVAFISVTSPAGVTSSNTGGDARVRVPSRLVKLMIVPQTNRVPVGFSVTLDAEGELTDGSVDDVSNKVVWTSSNPAVATVSNEVGTKGEVTALQNGTTIVSAVDPETGISSTSSGGDAVVAVEGFVVSIAITPEEVQLPTGLTRTFSVRATLDDGSEFSLSRRLVHWTSSNPAVASVSNDPATPGLVTALAKGEAVLSARTPLPTSISSSDSGGDTRIEVLGRMVGLAVRPRNRELFTGQTNRFSAVALLDDGTEARISRDIEFVSSDVSVVSVSNSSGRRGDATGMRKGKASISVVHRPTGLDSSATGGNATATVRGRVEGLRVDPPRAFYVLGTKPRLRARATFDDGSSDNIATDVVWTSSDPAVAEVGNQSPDKAYLFAHAVGRVVVSALEPVSGVSTADSGGDGIVRIVDGLERLRVREAARELRATDVVRLQALGRFPNPAPEPGEGPTVEVDMSDYVTWFSSNPEVAYVKDGRLYAVGLGETTVSALDERSGMLTTHENGDAVFRVVAQLERLKMKPRRVSVRLGSSRRAGFRVIGVFSDRARLELTDRVTFTTADPGVATVSSERDRFGLVVAVGEGRTTAVAAEPITGVRADQARTVIVKGGRKGRKGR